MDIFKLLAIISPFVSAALGGLITYIFTIRGKRYDLLYQSKIPAFKELSLELTAFRNYCLGKVASDEGNEFSPYLEEGKGTLTHRTDIALSIAHNGIFFKPTSRQSVGELMNNMSMLCNIELGLAAGKEYGNLKENYFEMANKTSDLIEMLYKELNLG
ncbi:hypothetical protein [Pedobacter antarcticus]|nr:hypothetical protein [Pedobacter antarcticus]